jgi:GTPase
MVVATKLDATTDRTRLEQLRAFCEKQGLAFHAISAATGEGVRELVRAIADALDKIPRSVAESAGQAEYAEDENTHATRRESAALPSKNL